MVNPHDKPDVKQHAKPQRRRTARKPGDSRVVRVETKDYHGRPRYITADLLDSSPIGIGVALRAPLEVGSTAVIRTNLDGKTNVPRPVRVSWCEEKSDGSFHAGLEFQDDH
jgi:hypothetical protein